MPGSDPTPPSPHPTRGGFLAFWTTLPGVLTASATLLTAVVGLLTLLDRPGADSAPPRVEPTVAAPAQASSPGSDERAGGGPAAAPASAEIVAQGQLTMRSPDSADLERGLVGSVPSGEDLYLFCSGDCILNAMRSLMAVAEGAGDRSACIDVLRSRREQALTLGQLRVGQELCLQTEEGHVGLIEILELPGPGSVEFVFAYALWR